MKTVRIKTKYKTSLSSYWAFLFKERWRHFNFHYGFCRKARVIKCSPFIIAKMGLTVPGVPWVDRGNWGRERPIFLWISCIVRSLFVNHVYRILCLMKKVVARIRVLVKYDLTLQYDARANALTAFSFVKYHQKAAIPHFAKVVNAPALMDQWISRFLQ